MLILIVEDPMETKQKDELDTELESTPYVFTAQDAAETKESRVTDSFVEENIEHVSKVDENIEHVPKVKEIQPIVESIQSSTPDVIEIPDACSPDAVSAIDNISASAIPEGLTVDPLIFFTTSSASEDSTSLAELVASTESGIKSDEEEKEKKTVVADIEETPKSSKPATLKLKYEYKPGMFRN